HHEIHNLFLEIESQLEGGPIGTYDFEYDQMVSMGEMLSTKIVNAYLNQTGISSKWFDVRDLIRTDNTYRQAKVDWKISKRNILTILGNYFEKEKIAVTQGFAGGTSENFNSTLGREG